jgi:hypothetical protein
MFLLHTEIRVEPSSVICTTAVGLVTFRNLDASASLTLIMKAIALGRGFRDIGLPSMPMVLALGALEISLPFWKPSYFIPGPGLQFADTLSSLSLYSPKYNICPL